MGTLLQTVFLIAMKRSSFLIYRSFCAASVFTGSCCLLLSLASCSGSRKTANQYQTMVVKPVDANATVANTSPEKRTITKYAAYLKIDPDSLTNVVLYTFIDKWMKTPYKYGGIDENGIDCSGFIQRLLNDVYNIQVPRTSAQQFFTKNVEPFHDNSYFSEGDLVFFCTVPGNPISHVGMYLRNRYFINASTSSGVSLASLDDPYWKKRFVAAGRVKITRQTATGKSQSTKSARQ